MKFNKLGSSELLASEVCLGTMTWGSWNSEEEAHAQLDLFLQLVEKENGGDWSKGKAMIDAAELYPVPPHPKHSGETERIIGRWLEKHPEHRDHIILASKVAGPWAGERNFLAIEREKDLGGDVDGDLPSVTHSPEQIRRALEASLVRLKTDHVELYQLHWPSRPAPTFGKHKFEKEMTGKPGLFPGPKVDACVQTIGELIKEGKIKAWGLSNETAFGVYMWSEACQRLGVPLPATIQQDFSLTDRVYEEGVLEATSYFNISLLSYGSLNGGALSGKYFDEYKGKDDVVIQATEKSRHTSEPKFQPRYAAAPARKAIKKYCELALKNDLAPAELALAWCYKQWYMGAVIIGATSCKQLEQNFKACEIDLSDEIMEKVEEIHLECPNPNRTT